MPVYSLSPGMVFSSFIFLFAFLPATLGVYYLYPAARAQCRAAGRQPFLLCVGRAPLRVRARRGHLGRLDDQPGDRRRPARLRPTPALAGRLPGPEPGAPRLVQVRDLRRYPAQPPGRARWASRSGPWVEVALPLGISFFTFHKISYVVDVYRGVSAPAASFGLCLLYICLFPHLIAGPIVRYRDVDRQLVARAHTADRFLSGICRFCLGLAKKVLVANVLAETADAVFDAPAGSLYPGRGLARRAGLQLPDLLRLLRLLGHGHRPRPHVRVRVPGELRPAVPLAHLHRVLAALAHLALPLHARLPLPPPRRQPATGRSGAMPTCGSCSCCPGSGTGPPGRSWCGAPTRASS